MSNICTLALIVPLLVQPEPDRLGHDRDSHERRASVAQSRTTLGSHGPGYRPVASRALSTSLPVREPASEVTVLT